MERVIEAGVGPEFLLNEANGYYSRKNIVVGANQNLKPGSPLGKITNAAGTVTPGAAIGAGDGAIGAWTVDAGQPAGGWRIQFQTSGATAAYVVYRPDNSIDGNGAVGTPYNGGINGTIADGATDYAAGTIIPMVVSYAAGSGLYVMHDPAGTDGRQVFDCFLYDGVVTGADETADAVGIERDAEVIYDRLAWGTHDAGQKTAVMNAALAKGIKRR